MNLIAYRDYDTDYDSSDSIHNSAGESTIYVASTRTLRCGTHRFQSCAIAKIILFG